MLASENISFQSTIDIKQFANGKRVFILTDENTLTHCLTKIVIPDDANILTIDSGEQVKNIDTCIFIWNELTNHFADRDALLINLGGGVICDIGGFVASCYKRGIAFVNIPTSLLAMVDASVGGKTGIDFAGYKNQIGTFQSAVETIILPRFLETLPRRELMSGMAEVVKHFIIADEAAFATFDREAVPDNSDWTKWKLTIQHAIAIKSNIVKEDPFEKAGRKKLNFGHTIGHAIESITLNTSNPLLHGEAVLVGMIIELFIASELKIIQHQEAQKAIHVLLKHFSPNYKVESVSDVLHLMKQDKKNFKGSLQFSLPNRIGHCLFNCEVPESVITQSVELYHECINS